MNRYMQWHGQAGRRRQEGTAHYRGRRESREQTNHQPCLSFLSTVCPCLFFCLFFCHACFHVLPWFALPFPLSATPPAYGESVRALRAHPHLPVSPSLHTTTINVMSFSLTTTSAFLPVYIFTKSTAIYKWQCFSCHVLACLLH